MKIITIRPDGSRRVSEKFETHKPADQSFKKDCDVNYIMKKYQKTGQISHIAKSQGVYADISEIKDLHTGMMVIQQAKESFDLLSADIRKKFNNNPAELYDYLQDPKNIDESIKLGLRLKPEEPIQNPTPNPIQNPTPNPIPNPQDGPKS